MGAHIVGLPQAKAKLRRLGAIPLDGAVRAGGLIVSADAKRRVPRVTGNLSRSITVQASGRTATGASVDVGTNVEYARRIELGFVGPDSLGRVYNQAPQPYLRPALDENEARVRAAVEAIVRQMIARLV